MLIIGPLHWTCAALTHNLFNGTKCSLLTVQIHRDVKRTSLRIVGHCAPALEPCRTGTHFQLDTQLRNFPWKVRDLPGLRIHLNDCLVPKVGCANELPVRSIELPEDPELTHFEKRLSSTGIN